MHTLRCISAHELKAVPPTARAEKQVFSPQAQTTKGSYVSRQTARELTLPRNYKEVQHQILINSLKYWLMNFVQESYFLEAKAGTSGNLHW